MIVVCPLLPGLVEGILQASAIRSTQICLVSPRVLKRALPSAATPKGQSSRPSFLFMLIGWNLKFQSPTSIMFPSAASAAIVISLHLEAHNYNYYVFEGSNLNSKEHSDRLLVHLPAQSNYLYKNPVRMRVLLGEVKGSSTWPGDQLFPCLKAQSPSMRVLVTVEFQRRPHVMFCGGPLFP